MELVLRRFTHQVKWLHEHGIDADVIVGAKTKDLIILEKEMEAVAGNLYITTDDGSYGRSGMVTKVIDDLIAEGKTYTKCVAIGPMIMMKFCCLTTKKLNIPTIVSMNPIMVDGTGMCGACRVMVGEFHHDHRTNRYAVIIYFSFFCYQVFDHFCYHSASSVRTVIGCNIEIACHFGKSFSRITRSLSLHRQ